jgi:biopolymer transport protein ExbD
MAGAAPVQTGKKGKKALDMELNLVPFIDLLSCLISFLLISAVWTQIAAVPARSTGNLRPDPPPLDPNDPTIAIRVTMTDRGYTLSLQSEAVEIPKTMVTKDQKQVMGYDVTQLTDKLKAVVQKIPLQKAVTIAPEDAVAFEDIVGTMDLIQKVPLPDVTVMPAVN